MFQAIGVKPVDSSFEVNTIYFDKFETHQFLKKHGFNTPLTVKADDIARTVIRSYPTVVKPRFGFGSNEINFANNREKLKFFLKYSAHEEMIIQEFISAPEYSFDILNDFNANVVTAVVKKKW